MFQAELFCEYQDDNEVKCQGDKKYINDTKLNIYKVHKNSKILIKNYPSVNQLTISLPSDMTSFPNNFLTNASNLKILYCRGSFIENLKSESFINAFNLEKIAVAANRIKTVDKDAFKNLTNLEALFLQQNFIEDLDENTFKDLSNLTRLFLQQNMIKKLPKNIFSNNLKLSELDLSSNKIMVFDFFSKTITKFYKSKNLEDFYKIQTRLESTVNKQNKSLIELAQKNMTLHKNMSDCFEEIKKFNVNLQEMKSNSIEANRIGKVINETNMNLKEMIENLKIEKQNIETNVRDLNEKLKDKQDQNDQLQCKLLIIFGISLGIFLVLIIYLTIRKVKSSPQCMSKISTINKIDQLKQKHMSSKSKNQASMQKTLKSVNEELKKTKEPRFCDAPLTQVDLARIDKLKREKSPELTISVPVRKSSMILKSGDITINKALPKLPNEDFLIYATFDLQNASNHKHENSTTKISELAVSSEIPTQTHIYGNIEKLQKAERNPDQFAEINCSLVHSRAPELIYATLDIANPKNVYLPKNDTIYASITHNEINEN